MSAAPALLLSSFVTTPSGPTERERPRTFFSALYRLLGVPAGEASPSETLPTLTDLLTGTGHGQDCGVFYQAKGRPPASPFSLCIDKEGASARRSLELHFAQPDVPSAARKGLTFHPAKAAA